MVSFCSPWHLHIWKLRSLLAHIHGHGMSKLADFFQKRKCDAQCSHVVGISYCFCHDGVIKWKHFPRYWPFVREIHRSPVNFPHKGQWRGALMFALICVWINGWVNNREAGDLRRYRSHYDVIVMYRYFSWLLKKFTGTGKILLIRMYKWSNADGYV